MSISRKIVLSIALALAVAFAVTSWITASQSASTTRDLAYQLATEAAGHQGQAIQTELEHAMGLVRALEFYSRESVIQGNTNRALLNQVLARTVKDNPGSLLGAWMLWEPNAYDDRDEQFVNAPLHDHTGRVNSYWHWDDSGQVILENNVDWENAPWYNEPRKAGKPILLDPYTYKVSGVDTMLISLIAPVIIEDSFKGVMGVDFKLDTLQKYIRDVKVLGNSYAALIANDGTYIAHIDSQKVGKSLGNTPEEQQNLRSIQGGKASIRIGFDPYLQEEAHTLYTPIVISGAAAPWSLAVSIPTRVIDQPSITLRRFTLTAGIISLLAIIVIVGMLVHQFVAAPLKILERAVRQVGENDYKVAVPVHSHDEIGSLSKAFNRMAQQIDQSQHQLEEAEHEVRTINEALEERVEQRTDELSQANRELADARDRAEQASRSKSNFLANMSHEIRTPLNGVLGMVELLEGTSLNEEQKHYTRIIQSSGKTLLTVINDILDYSKIEANKLDLENEPFYLSDLIEDIVSPYRLMRHASIHFVAYVEPNVPNHLRGDTVRIQQVISNLLNNAFKFTQRGFIILRISCEERDEHRALIKCLVSDTGIGISQKQQDQLFQPFNQADSSTTRKYGGSGLGLAICRQLVDKMGGTIELNSEPHKGSCFSFTINADTESESEVVAAEVELEGRELMVLDDLEVYHEIYAQQAKALGMEIVLTRSGENLIKQLEDRLNNKKPLPDVILADLELVNTNVHELAQHLAQNSEFQKIPRILMTASSIKPDTELLSSFDSCHYKSTSVESLRKVISHCLRATPETELSAPEPDQQHLKGMHLLVAEDNQINRMVAGGLLRKMGIEAAFVENGQQALTVRRDSGDKLDLILMDCEMPIMDGYRATEKIREWEQANAQNRVPIYALTAHVLPENLERCLSAGMDGRLGKPINAEKLQAVLDSVRADSAVTSV